MNARYIVYSVSKTKLFSFLINGADNHNMYMYLSDKKTKYDDVIEHIY